MEKQIKEEKDQIPPAPVTPLSAHRRQFMLRNSSFAVREAYRTLRTNVRFALQGTGCKRICITSSTPGEGKSITLLNLALSIAEAGQKVLLIDADLRKPAQARLMNETATPGLSNYLVDMTDAKTIIHKDICPNLDMIFSGDIPPNPSELLETGKFIELIEEQSKAYEYILLDTPPVNLVSDACLIASHLDGVLVLVRQGMARKDTLKRVIDNLQFAGAKILGFVLNGVAHDEKKNYSYYD
ncbi:MAG: CpsD/CapB family tyrosine-protein kinase [Oscillospiraceae bacterium]|nr:CpsD/CapB family tyrosine-protein kinase [Oscillospiraceae bacterium]